MPSGLEDPLTTDVPESSSGNGVGTALWNLICHPVDTFILRWNWKAASLSAAIRAPIFLFTSIRHGWQSISMAVAVEAVYSAGISGFYGAFTQELRNTEPSWLAALLVTAVMPALLQWADYGVHLAAGTPNLKTGVIVSVIWAAISSLFNWYIMRRGALLVGGAGRSFGSDMSRMPILIANFLLELPRWLVRTCKSVFRT
jgi:hypothetical protein